MEGNITTLAIIIACVVVIFVFGIAILYSMFYKKASANKAFVRTGKGGKKVILDGGTWFFPIFHEIKEVSLQTMKVEVIKEKDEAFITQDRLRVDIGAEFYIRTRAVEQDVINASQSLGDKALSAISIKGLIEEKLVSALRSITANFTLQKLHENRDDFADAVQQTLASVLIENGLTLEDVSVFTLDQTGLEYFNKDNVFDATGLRNIVAQTAQMMEETNKIEREKEVKIKTQDVLTIKEKLELDKERDIAIKEQEKEIATMKSHKEASKRQFIFEQERITRQKEIFKERAIKESEIEKEQFIKARDIVREQEIEQATINKNKSINLINISQEKEIKLADIEREKSLIEKQREKDEAEIQKELSIEKALKDKEIGIIQKEEEKALAQAKKLKVMAQEEQAKQNVITVSKSAEAERKKLVEIIEAQQEAEKNQIKKKIAADAQAYEIEKKAEADYLASVKKADSIKILAEADLLKAKAIAEGEEKLITARNKIDSRILIEDALMELIKVSPELARELMEPAKHIDSIKVLNVGGSQQDQTDLQKTILNTSALLPVLKEVFKFTDLAPEEIKTSVKKLFKENKIPKKITLNDLKK